MLVLVGVAGTVPVTQTVLNGYLISPWVMHILGCVGVGEGETPGVGNGTLGVDDNVGVGWGVVGVREDVCEGEGMLELVGLLAGVTVTLENGESFEYTGPAGASPPY